MYILFHIEPFSFPPVVSATILVNKAEYINL